MSAVERASFIGTCIATDGADEDFCNEGDLAGWMGYGVASLGTTGLTAALVSMLIAGRRVVSATKSLLTAASANLNLQSRPISASIASCAKAARRC